MTIYKQAVNVRIGDVPTDFPCRSVRLDPETTLIIVSDHPMWGRSKGEVGPNNKDGTDLDAFIDSHGWDRVDHPDAASVTTRITSNSDHPAVDTAPYPDQAKYNGGGMPTQTVENGRVIWDEG